MCEPYTPVLAAPAATAQAKIVHTSVGCAGFCQNSFVLCSIRKQALFGKTLHTLHTLHTKVRTAGVDYKIPCRNFGSSALLVKDGEE